MVPDDKDEYSYDENGNQTLRINYNWNVESESFVQNSKYENYYDNDNNQLYLIIFSWNSELEIFTPTSKTYFEYDEQKRLVSENRYSIDICSGSKILQVKVGYFYIDGSDSRGYISYQVDTSTGDFTWMYSTGYFYNQDGKLFKRIQDVNLDFYPDTFKYYWDISYDENGNQTLYIRYDWDSTIQDYKSYKRESSYDENNFKTQEIVYSWYPTLGVYKPNFKMDISTFSETDTKLVREGIMYEYDTNFNTWNELEGEEFKSYWYYTKNSSLSTNSVEQKSFSIYPNPTKGFLKINSSEPFIDPTIEVYDLKGSRILSKPFKTDDNINISELKPSIYFYKIIDGNEVKQSGKLIKE